MKQVTGSNSQPFHAKRVSVQLTLDGHFFSVPAVEVLRAAEEIELLSPATVLLPQTASDPQHAEAMFAANGLPLAADRRILTITQQNPDGALVALVAVAAETQASLTAWCSEGVRYTTPLLTPVEAAEPTIRICDTGSIVYIRLFDAGLQLAEAVPVETEQDRLYLLGRLCERIDPKRFVLQLEDRAGNLRSYKNLFKKTIVCAS